MPTVPTRGIPQANIRPDTTPFQQARGLSPRAFGSGIADAVGDAGTQIGQEADRFAAQAQRNIDENNRRLAKQAQINYMREVGQLWSGDGTPENPGFGNLQGAAAVDSAEAYRQSLTELRARHLEGVPQSVLEDLDLNLQTLEIQELNQANRHVESQARIAERTASDALLERYREEALRNHVDPDNIGLMIRRGKAEIRQYQQSIGAPPETIADEEQMFETTVHTSVIERFLADKEVNVAEQYFNQNKDNIDSDLHAKIIESLSAAKNQNLGLILDQTNDAIKVAERGFKDPNEDALLGALGQVEGSPRARRALRGLRNAADNRQSVNRFIRKSIPDQAADLRKLRPDPGATLTRHQIARFDALSKAHSYMTTQISKGFGLQMADQAGAISGLRPLDFTADTLSQDLRERLVQAERADEALGVPVTILNPGEEDALISMFESTPTRDLQVTLSNFSQGLGREGLTRLGAQVAADDPVLAYALSYSTENPALSVRAIEGRRFLVENNEFEPTKDETLTSVERAYGSLFALAPGAERAFIDAAAAIYALDRKESGKLAFDTDDFEDVLTRVAGEPLDYNGQLVLPPRPNMSETDFEDVIESLSNQDLVDLGTGRPVGVDGRPFDINLLTEPIFDSSSATLVTSGFGRYIIRGPGGGVVLNERGGTYELNLNSRVGN